MRSTCSNMARTAGAWPASNRSVSVISRKRAVLVYAVHARRYCMESRISTPAAPRPRWRSALAVVLQCYRSACPIVAKIQCWFTAITFSGAPGIPIVGGAEPTSIADVAGRLQAETAENFDAAVAAAQQQQAFQCRQFSGGSLVAGLAPQFLEPRRAAAAGLVKLVTSRIFLVVALVIFLGGVEFARSGYLGYDFALERLVLHERRF